MLSLRSGYKKELSKTANNFKFLTHRLTKFHMGSDYGMLYKAVYRFCCKLFVASLLACFCSGNGITFEI